MSILWFNQFLPLHSINWYVSVKVVHNYLLLGLFASRYFTFGIRILRRDKTIFTNMIYFLCQFKWSVTLVIVSYLDLIQVLYVDARVVVTAWMLYLKLVRIIIVFLLICILRDLVHHEQWSKTCTARCIWVSLMTQRDMLPLVILLSFVVIITNLSHDIIIV